MGQRVTNLIPHFSGRRYVGFTGEVLDNPFMPICRSQVDISIEGNFDKLLVERRGFVLWRLPSGIEVRAAEGRRGNAGDRLAVVLRAKKISCLRYPLRRMRRGVLTSPAVPIDINWSPVTLRGRVSKSA